MTVFKGYLLIIKRNFLFLCIFGIVFTAVCYGISTAEGTDTSNALSAENMNIAVVDLDESDLSKGLIDMLGKAHTVTLSDGDKSALTEELYARTVDYVITIPKGYEKSFIEAVEKKTDLPQLETTGVPDSTEGYYLDNVLASWLNETRLYLAGGFTLSSAMDKADALSQDTSGVSMLVQEEETENSVYSDMMQYFPYLYLAVLCYVTMFINKAFREKEIYNRMQCSAVPPANQTLQALLAFGLLYGGFWILTLLLPTVTKGTAYLTSPMFRYYALNTLCLLLTAIGLGQLVSVFIKPTDAAISGVTNVVSIGFSFVCGVFVPMEFLSEGVIRVARFLPVYWYEVANMALKDTLTITTVFKETMTKCLGIQFAFAAGLIGFSLLMQSFRQRKK